MVGRIDPAEREASVSFPSTTALVEDLRSRRISAAEALERAIARIEARDAELNAVVVRDFGLPATAMPVGPDSSVEDRITLAFAQLAEREFGGGFRPPPGFP